MASGFGELVAEARRRRAAVDVAVLRRVDSTSLLASRIRRELAEDDIAIPGTAIVAFEQTAGKGRQGRHWASAAGHGVYATVVATLPEGSALPVLPLAMAVALAEVLDRYLPTPCRLKWPNDLMVDGRKLGGILVEAALRPGVPASVLVGFGVNHGQAAEELPTAQATSLRVTGGALPALGALTWELVAAVVAELRAGRAGSETVARWLARSQHAAGDSLLCRVGEREVRGVFAGLSAEGRLRLEVDGREEVLVSAEIAEAS
jgi:BirA family biotin operon repressor/biotin-[acetyl-CoA-carboxylase] ligase